MDTDSKSSDPRWWQESRLSEPSPQPIDGTMPSIQEDLVKTPLNSRCRSESRGADSAGGIEDEEEHTQLEKSAQPRGTRFVTGPDFRGAALRKEFLSPDPEIAPGPPQ